MLMMRHHFLCMLVSAERDLKELSRMVDLGRWNMMEAGERRGWCGM